MLNISPKWLQLFFARCLRRREIRFFSTLSNESRERLIVREYPVDYGWHIEETIKSRFPILKFSTHEKFNEVLDKCSLYISDHLATTWMEAIYAGKPTLFLLVDHEISIQNYKFREEEKKYIKMLEEVGIIVHDPGEAATLINRFAEHGVMEWWMNGKRQSVMKLVRERWTTKVDHIDNWWYHELMGQAERVEGVS